MTPSAGHVDAARVTVYEDAAGEFRWSASDTNGAKVADSGEGYVERSYAVQAALNLFPDAEIVEMSGE